MRENNRMEPLLTIHDVSKRFGGIHALQGVNIELRRDEILGVIGPNGAGKTTLFNVICGVYRPNSGKILLRGKEIQGRKPYWIAQKGIGRTFQICQPFKELSALENVLVSYGHLHYGRLSCLGNYKMLSHVEKALDLLVQLGLDQYKDWEAKDLPLVLQKRLEIARAMALNPDVLLLDESAAGLTFEESMDLVQLIREIKKKGKTIILIEHNMNVAMKASERIYVLDHGAVIAEGTPEEIQGNERVINAYLGSE